MRAIALALAATITAATPAAKPVGAALPRADAADVIAHLDFDTEPAAEPRALTQH